MPQPPESDEIRRGVEKLPFKKRKGGKEFNFPVFIGDRMVARITVPRGGKFVPPRTFKSICDQASLTDQQMRELCRCTLRGKDYVELWTEAWALGKSSPLG